MSQDMSGKDPLRTPMPFFWSPWSSQLEEIRKMIDVHVPWPLDGRIAWPRMAQCNNRKVVDVIPSLLLVPSTFPYVYLLHIVINREWTNLQYVFSRLTIGQTGHFIREGKEKNQLQLWPFTSYNWLFQWDYTFYKWGFVMAITVFAIQNMFVRSIRHMQTHQDIGPVPLKAVRRSREVHLFFRLPSGRSTRRTGKSPCLINQMVLDLSLYIHSLSIYIYKLGDTLW